MSKGVCNFWDFLPSFEINFSMELGAWKLQRHSSLSRHTTFSLSERKNMQKPKRTRYLYPHVSWRKQSSGCTCIPGRESIHSKSIMETNRQEKKEPVQLIIFFQLPCCCNHSYPIGNSVLHFSLIDNKNKSSNIFTSFGSAKLAGFISETADRRPEIHNPPTSHWHTPSSDTTYRNILMWFQ